VADLLAMDRPTLTANLKPLERPGLVVSTVDPPRPAAEPHGQGRALLAQAMPVWRATHAEVDARLARRGRRPSQRLTQLGLAGSEKRRRSVVIG
jgi:DNA-binding MarR family transcriptional regulator